MKCDILWHWLIKNQSMCLLIRLSHIHYFHTNQGSYTTRNKLLYAYLFQQMQQHLHQKGSNFSLFNLVFVITLKLFNVNSI